MKKNNVLCCPVCKEVLLKEDRVFRCNKNHVYDIAKEGYVNLLLAQKKNSKDPGDSKEMIDARKNFLSKGYYHPLALGINNCLRGLITGNSLDNINILDAGCGEGYYLDRLSQELQEYSNLAFYGLDISKAGVRLAAKKNKNISFAVGSIFDMPIKSQSIDCLLSIFAPIAEQEFTRVLKPNGKALIVSPGAHHLYGLKKLLYENPYLNDEDKVSFDNLAILDKIRVGYDFKLVSREDINNLILMTPYYWNTDMSKIVDLINEVDELETKADFIISVYHKKGMD